MFDAVFVQLLAQRCVQMLNLVVAECFVLSAFEADSYQSTAVDQHKAEAGLQSFTMGISMNSYNMCVAIVCLL